MNTIMFAIHDLPPMPRNRSHRATRNMVIKTELCREFEKDLTSRLQQFEEQFMLFRLAYKPKLHFIRARYTIYTPRDILFTKQDAISSRSVDWDAHKVMQDVIFKEIGLDDKLIRHGTVVTPISQDGKWNYHFHLELRTLNELDYTNVN